MTQIFRLKVVDVAERLEEECFDESQKGVLEFVQGKRLITIKKQFLKHYIGFKIRTVYKTEDDFFDAFCMVLKESEYIINQIKTRQYELNRLTNPLSYRLKQQVETKTKDETLDLKKLDTKTDRDSNSYVIETNKNASNNVDYSISKAGDNEVNRLHDLERDLLRNPLRTPIFSIDSKKMKYENNTLSVEASVPGTYEEETPDDKPSEIIYTKISYSSASSKSGQLYESETNTGEQSHVKTLVDENSNRKIDKEGTVDTVSYNYSEAEIAIESISKEIPALRYEFGSSFISLFDPIY